MIAAIPMSSLTRMAPHRIYITTGSAVTLGECVLLFDRSRLLRLEGKGVHWDHAVVTGIVAVRNSLLNRGPRPLERERRSGVTRGSGNESRSSAWREHDPPLWQPKRARP